MHAGSPPAFDLAAAAGGVCDIVWLVGWQPGELAVPDQLLGRLGEVVRVGAAGDVLPALAGRTLDGAVGFDDWSLVMAARVAEAHDLPGRRIATAMRLTDKLEQRRALAAGGVTVPSAVACTGGADLPVPCPVKWPAVLKPRGGFGSRDAYLVAGADEARALLARLDGDFLLEEYLVPAAARRPEVGPSVTVESAVLADGAVRHLAISQRLAFVPPFRSTGLLLPADLDGSTAAAVEAEVDAAIRAIGTGACVTNTEVQLTEAGPRIIEVNGRPAGRRPRMLRELGGPDLLAVHLRLGLGQDPGDLSVSSSQVAWFSYLMPPEGVGRVAAIDGLEVATALPSVTSVTVNRPPGSEVDSAWGTPAHVVAVHGVAADHEAAYGAWAQLRRVVRITYG